jgi:hypothetical protein
MKLKFIGIERKSHLVFHSYVVVILIPVFFFERIFFWHIGFHTFGFTFWLVNQKSYTWKVNIFLKCKIYTNLNLPPAYKSFMINKQNAFLKSTIYTNFNFPLHIRVV